MRCSASWRVHWEGGAWMPPRADDERTVEMDRTRRILCPPDHVGLALVAAACSNSDTATLPRRAVRRRVARGDRPAASRRRARLGAQPRPRRALLRAGQGLLRRQNLTVEFHPPSNAADPIKLVGLDKVDLAISYEPEMFYGQQNGLPVMAVATVVPVPLNSMIVSPPETSPARQMPASRSASPASRAMTPSTRPW